MTVRVSSATDTGLKRSHNEDSLGTWEPDDPADRARRGVLLVIADGMGGSRAGEVASRLAVETVLERYREAEGNEILDELCNTVEEANRIIHDHSMQHPEHHGMGTTCTALVVRDRDAFIAHVGDSRAYAIRDGEIRQLTQDHSLVAQLVSSRQITPEQARVDPRRNLVTRSVGVGAHVEVDTEHVDGGLREGDTLLLCTDGLHGVVSDDELAQAASGSDLDWACRELVGLARDRGGPDNITLILARLVPSTDGVHARDGTDPASAPRPEERPS
jgi:PPM family protein phosphatase